MTTSRLDLGRDEIADIEAWCGEPLVWEGDEGNADHLEQALDSRRFRGQALAQARMERSLGLDRPSPDWRRRYGFALGLMRIAAIDPPQLADGTILGEHQAEVVEGTAAAMVARAERPGDYPAPADDPGAAWRVWIEHATGAGKSVTAAALVDAQRVGATLILTHRSNLVTQFIDELTSRGYGHRLREFGDPDVETTPGAVSIATYQLFAQRWLDVDPDTYDLIVCDEVHTSLGDVTSNALQAFEETPMVGMTATGKLIAKDVSSLFPEQVSQFDLNDAAELNVISPLRAVRIPAAVHLDTLAGVKVRGGDFDTEELAALLDRDPLNYACARLYRETFGDLSGIVYAAGVDHAERLAVAFVAAGVPAAAVSGRTPKRELARVLEDFDAGRLQVLINAQLLAEGWNCPRVTVCLQLAPTASRRIYQQRIGRVTRRAPGKEAGIVVDFVDPAYRNDGKVITLHALLDEDVYRAGELVTRPGTPAAEPAAISYPDELVPVAADPARRARALESVWHRATLTSMRTEDQRTWARAAGANAPSTGQLRQILSRLGAIDDSLLVDACAAAAEHNTRPDVRAQALDNLAAHRSQAAFDALVDLAGRTDNPVHARQLSARALQAAAAGAPAGHEQVLALARAEQAVYERIARTDPALRNVTLPVSGSDEMTIARLLRAVQIAPPEQAAAILAILPVSSPRMNAEIAAAAQERFAASASLVRALTAHRDPRRRGTGDEVVYSAR